MATRPTAAPDEQGVRVRYDQNDEQTLLVFEGEQATGVVAIDADADVDAARELVDTVEAEIAHTIHGLRADRSPISRTIRGP